MDLLGFITLVVTGFTACAEFGSYAFVHPVIRRLPPEHHIRVEQGLLGTFGRVMPILMTLSVVFIGCLRGAFRRCPQYHPICPLDIGCVLRSLACLDYCV
jgi:hypothetical protein